MRNISKKMGICFLVMLVFFLGMGSQGLLSKAAVLSLSKGGIQYLAEGDTLTVRGRGVMEDVASVLDKVSAGEAEAITKAVVEEGITAVGDRAFYGCQNLREVSLPKSLERIGEAAFLNCKKLTSVEIPQGVTAIDRAAFGGCESLFRVVMGEQVSEIGKEAFKGDLALTEITLPGKIKTIEAETFSGASSLKEITIPGSVVSIKDFAFKGCKSLAAVTVPDSVRSLGVGAFQECASLKKAVIGSGVDKLPIQLFRSCQSLTEVSFGEKVEEIGEQCFCYCVSLKSFTVPDSVLRVGKNAFYGCGELALTLPDSMESNGDGSYQQRGGMIVEGEYLYSEALAVLNLVNEERGRQGLSALSMDAELLEGAMLRAAELSVDFSHLRPSGSNFSTVSVKAASENIGAGTGSARDIFNDWMASAGHRANIMDAGAKSIGIGCFVQGKNHYWVQIFSQEEADRAGNGQDRSVRAVVRARAGAYPMQLEETEFELEPKESADVKVILKNAGNPSLVTELSTDMFSWHSSNEKAVTVKDGTITAIGAGKATVTASSKYGDGQKLSASVRVSAKVSKIRLEDKNIRLALGSTYRLKPEILPENASNPGISYKSSNKKIVSVSGKGLLKAKKKGTARITLKSKDGSAKTTVKVTVGDYASSLRLLKASKKMTVKEKQKLTVALLPSGIRYTGVRFTSSDRTIASVNRNGVVTAKKPGKATITCQAKYGSSAKKSVAITVLPEAPVYRVTAGKGKAVLKLRKAKGVTQYAVYISRKPDRGFHKAGVARGRSYTIEGLKKGRTYYVKVKAAGKAGKKLLTSKFGEAKKVKVK